MTRSLLGLLAMAMMSAACGSGDTQVSAAAPPVAAAEAPATSTVADRAASEMPARPARSTAPSRVSTPRIERAAASPVMVPAATPVAVVPDYREFILPAGTTLALELKSAVASDVSEVEDTVRATLRQAVILDGHEVLPAGTELAGTVTEAERAGRVKGRARIAFQFTSLRYDSERIPVRTEPIAHEGEATKGEDATKIGVGAGAGAVIGGLLGGKGGAAKGAAIGGAAGTGVVLATRGKDVRLEPGTDVPATLAAPLAIRVRVR